MKKIIVALFTSALLVACGDSKVNLLSVNDFETQIKKDSVDAQIVDVRTPGEYSDDHINSAINIDWNGENFEELSKKLDASKPTFVYCAGGKRSAEAAAKLVELGFKEVYDLDGGFRQWNKEGKATELGASAGNHEMSVADFNKYVASKKMVLVDFNATWCGPCKQLAPILDEIAAEKMDSLDVLKIDVDEQKTIANHFKVDGIPSLQLYQNGKLVWEGVGLMQKAQLLEVISEFE
jgi:thioredoxin 1